MRASVLPNSGTGGALFWIAELSAVRTESISGSSICAPARALCGSASESAPAAAPPRHWRRERPGFFKAVDSGRRQAARNEVGDAGGRHLGRRRVAAMLVFELAFLEAAVGDHHPVRHADQLPVGE